MKLNGYRCRGTWAKNMLMDRAKNDMCEKVVAIEITANRREWEKKTWYADRT